MTEAKPHYHGHRERLRQRFLEGGADALPDYELLELVLFLIKPQGDVKPLAKELIARFGSLAGVLNASAEELTTVAGIKDISAVGLKTVQAAAHRLLKQDILKKQVLNTWDRLIGYCRAVMAHERNEHFRVLFLNSKNELIADEVQSSGTVNHTPVYPREIMKRALEVGATALILVHNHPSGDPSPSGDDVEMTRAIMEAGKPFSIVVHDHVIVSRKGHTSLRSGGYI